MFKIEIMKENEISLLAQKAGEVWREHYEKILGFSQIEYMLEKFQSENAVRLQLNEGYTYYFLTVDGKIGGYICIKPFADYLYLSKLYILKDYRGKGFAKKTLSFLSEQAKKLKLSKIRLSVNKENSSSIAAYEKMGFVRYNSAVRDIGNGFVMDDYDYEYIVK